MAITCYNSFLQLEILLRWSNLFDFMMALWCVIVILFTFRCAYLDVTKNFNAFSLTAWDSSRFLFQPVTVSLKLYNYPATAIPDMFLTRQHSAIATMRLFCWQLRPMSASILRHAPRLCPPDAELILKVLSAPAHGGLVCIYCTDVRDMSIPLAPFWGDEHAYRSYFYFNRVPGFWLMTSQGSEGSSWVNSVMWKRYQDGLQHLAELLVDERPEAWHFLVPRGWRFWGAPGMWDWYGLVGHATLWIVTIMDPEILMNPNELNLPPGKYQKTINNGFVLDLFGASFSLC